MNGREAGGERSVLADISKYRDCIMGAAIVWVVAFHSGLNLGPLGVVKSSGYAGVDIFMLLSGFGVYFSLSERPDALAFYGRRMRRLLISYFAFILPWSGYMLLFGGATLEEIWGNLLLTGWWLGRENQFNWYIQAVWAFYLAAPLLARLVGRAKGPAGAAWLLGGALLFSSAFLHHAWLMALSRLPIFLVGMFAARALKEGRRLSRRGLGALFALAAAGLALLAISRKYLSDYLWTLGLWWYPFLLIAPALVAGLCLLLRAMERFRAGKWAMAGLAKLGRSSLEIYFVHIFAFGFVPESAEIGNLWWCALAIGALLAGMAYGRAIAFGILRNSCKR